MNRSVRQSLVFILSFVALSSVFATAGYFYKDAKEEAAPSKPLVTAAIPRITLPIIAPLANDNPSANEALTALFSLPAQNNQLKTTKDNLASLWFEQTFEDGINKYHVFFIKNQLVDVHTNEIYESHGHADAPIISAVVYKFSQEKWALLSKQKNIGVFGSWGDAPPIEKAEFLRLAKGNTALLLDISYSGQGYTNKGKTIFSYHEKSWKLLGFLQTGGDNEGLCDDDIKDDELLSPCWKFNGKISLSKTPEDDDYPNVLISRSGTMSDKNGKVVPVTDSIYSFNGEEYLIEASENDEDMDDMDEDDEI